ncbi:hypothetical protein ABQF35_14540 [Mycobacterium syngnathidarum]
MNETDTLRGLIAKARRERDKSVRQLALTAQEFGHKIVGTTLNAIEAGTYHSTPTAETIRAIGWLANVSDEIAFAAAGRAVPGPPFSQELPPGVDDLTSPERRAAIAMLRALVAQRQEINRYVDTTDDHSPAPAGAPGEARQDEEAAAAVDRMVLDLLEGARAIDPAIDLRDHYLAEREALTPILNTPVGKVGLLRLAEQVIGEANEKLRVSENAENYGKFDPGDEVAHPPEVRPQTSNADAADSVAAISRMMPDVESAGRDIELRFKRAGLHGKRTGIDRKYLVRDPRIATIRDLFDQANPHLFGRDQPGRSFMEWDRWLRELGEAIRAYDQTNKAIQSQIIRLLPKFKLDQLEASAHYVDFGKSYDELLEQAIGGLQIGWSKTESLTASQAETLTYTAKQLQRDRQTAVGYQEATLSQIKDELTERRRQLQETELDSIGSQQSDDDLPDWDEPGLAARTEPDYPKGQPEQGDADGEDSQIDISDDAEDRAVLDELNAASAELEMLVDDDNNIHQKGS